MFEPRLLIARQESELKRKLAVRSRSHPDLPHKRSAVTQIERMADLAVFPLNLVSDDSASDGASA
ncbi:hypothetical protein AB0P45_16175, partial [Streptomyces niveus]